MPDIALDLDDGDDRRGHLLQYLYPRLVLWCAARMSRKLKAHTEPVRLAREVLARLRENLGQFTGRDHTAFNAWVFGHVAEQALLDGERFYTPGLHPLPEFPHTAKLERLQQAIGMLSPEHKDVLRLRRFEERSIPHVAEAMGRTVTAARSLYNEALKSLTSCIPPA